MDQGTAARLDDPAWFPLDYDAGADALRFLPVPLEALGAASFLDPRLAVDWAAAEPLPIAALGPLPAARPALLLHTAFCGSTLLARALHDPPRTVALKEPYALSVITQVSAAERADAVPFFNQRIEAALALLGRPWSPGGRVLVKPSSPENRALARLLALTAPQRAILLYSGFEDFLLSCCKKLPAAEVQIRRMAQTLLSGSLLAERLGIPPEHPLGFVESCALAWHAQIDRYAAALDADADDRLRTLDFKALLAQPLEAVVAATRWYGFAHEPDRLAARVAAEFARDAKAPGRQYSAAQRGEEKRALEARYAPLVRAALAWADEVVVPATRRPREWKPLLD